MFKVLAAIVAVLWVPTTIGYWMTDPGTIEHVTALAWQGKLTAVFACCLLCDRYSADETD